MTSSVSSVNCSPSNQNDLPILAQVPELVAQLHAQELALLSAEPGAGKTTRLPIALMQHPAFQNGKIIMTAPRRVAAQAAASYMAGLIGESVGERIGYRVKGESKVSAQTRLELVTSGVLLRMLQRDPTLDGISLVILDEFHERTVDSDLILALCRQMNQLYRDDNPAGLLVMSATLAQEALETALQVPILFCEGRVYPLEYHYNRTSVPLSDRVQATIERCLEVIDTQNGDLLCFLPGVGEINRVAEALSARCQQANIDLRQLHGQQKLAEQQAAIAPAQKAMRRCILATAIAETSLTIDGICLVVDSGLAREARFDKEAGVVRLHTRPVTRAEAKQRAGRAGRTQAGQVFRCWSEDQQGALSPQPEPEINRQDLSELALQLVQWGSDDPDEFDWVTPPPKSRWQSALSRLQQLKLLEMASGSSSLQLTAFGQASRELVLSAHLGRGWLSLLQAADKGVDTLKAEQLAACAFVFSLLQEGAHLPENALLSACEHLILSPDPANKALCKRIEQGAIRLLKESHHLIQSSKSTDTVYKNSFNLLSGLSSAQKPAACLIAQLQNTVFIDLMIEGLCHAYSDKVGLKQTQNTANTGDAGIYKLSNGRQAQLKSHQQPEFVIALHARSFSQDSRETLTLWLELDKKTVTDHLADQIQHQPFCHWQGDRLINSVQTRLGALVLDEKQGEKPNQAALNQAGILRLQQQGIDALPWQEADIALRQRIEFLRQNLADQSDEQWPDLTDQGLLDSVEAWLVPFLTGVNNQRQWQQLPISDMLKSLLSWPQQQALDTLAPAMFQVASGRSVKIDYSQNPPTVSTKLQEMFGTEQVPTIAGIPVTIHLLSPAGRPLAVTSNLATFWREVYPEVRKEMRGRYPKHPWPEDPLTAEATHKTKKKLGN
ncbi:ATP-dependent helicase HrpB [Oceanospirillum multiglobuliferum]|uniref:ATP-dependent helicase HrpB n=1 Tax=Oceanospirillum multiglobuliferum TaxID=64969 RepID=A0A1T4S7M8_9GAMM|nr:ATP-dependent helicase HrpB [Oceanospirillum multiglobuliferum]OPX54408.1 ATP-dependent helicase HrpB [Oceanospirillum multiglobuliferum]SKA24157.1 ATP-dependent helicase HrpB [Oceanospirillum multiglobuliferum]